MTYAILISRIMSFRYKKEAAILLAAFILVGSVYYKGYSSGVEAANAECTQEREKESSKQKKMLADLQARYDELARREPEKVVIIDLEEPDKLCMTKEEWAEIWR